MEDALLGAGKMVGGYYFTKNGKGDIDSETKQPG